MSLGEGRGQRTRVIMIETEETRSGSASAIQKVTIGCASQKGRSRPPQLTENRTTVGTQHQLQKERLSAARLSLMVNCSAAFVIRVGPLVL
jgi:hypothetical protein